MLRSEMGMSKRYPIFLFCQLISGTVPEGVPKTVDCGMAVVEGWECRFRTGGIHASGKSEKWFQSSRSLSPFTLGRALRSIILLCTSNASSIFTISTLLKWRFMLRQASVWAQFSGRACGKGKAIIASRHFARLIDVG